MKNRSYERKGDLYKKSLNNDKFKQRKFVLLGEQLFYYKKNIMGIQDKYYNLISLQNARISILKVSAAKLKTDKMYNYCFELENDTRTWVLACKSQEDLLQWHKTIYTQIE